MTSMVMAMVMAVIMTVVIVVIIRLITVDDSVVRHSVSPVVGVD